MAELKTYKVERGGLIYNVQLTAEAAKEAGLVEHKETEKSDATTKPKTANKSRS